MQMLASLILACAFCGVRSVIRTPLEAFRPSAEIHIRRPDKLPLPPHRRTTLPPMSGIKILYQTGVSEDDLPDCRPRQVCSKVDLYDASQPWIEKKCRCLGHRPCSRYESELSADDNHTLADKTTLYKTCEPVKRLPKCRYFKDAAWIIYTFADTNATQQIVNCHCPKFSVTYLLKKLPYTASSGEQGNQYQFGCSPQSRLRCSRKEPCKLFSARRRHEQIDEVNANTICQCPRDHSCPRHHTEPGVLPGITYASEDIRTYHGYCMQEPPPDTFRFVGDKD
ncbi:protein giant-lens isoform X1 [Bombyx mandarina]|uniref:Protein giant-lens n=2 Tax=Bombyx TaxID=7090 RepID=A0A8R2C7K8_BOMMO|nr:protein giant-lens isoform X1 [Bombyx mori]XP_028037707.1 protein giant-lens isoform X1 [Bombyx mandarina]